LRHKLATEAIVLVALLLISLAVGLALVARGEVALAERLLQGTDTNTPDPNSPQATPTLTWTPLPTDTPTDIVTPSDTPTGTPSDTPAVLATDTPTALPTDTPFAFPTDTPFVLPTDTPFVFPTDTPFVFPTDTPLAPIDSPTPPVLAPEPILPPPAPPFTPDQPITMPLDAILVIPPPAEETAPIEDAAGRRRLDPALFIDNLVIAFGYVWMCFGGLAMVAAALGGVWLWRRRSRPPAQPVPDPGQTTAQPPTAASAPPPPPAPPPAPTRVAARRRSSPPPDLD
jgi:hypothetical protein